MPLTAGSQFYLVPAELFGSRIVGVEAQILAPPALDEAPVLAIQDRTGRIVYSAPSGTLMGVGALRNVTWGVVGAPSYLKVGAAGGPLIIPMAEVALEEGDAILILFDNATTVLIAEPILLYN